MPPFSRPGPTKHLGQVLTPCTSSGSCLLVVPAGRVLFWGVSPFPHQVFFAFLVSLPLSRTFPHSCSPPSVVVELRRLLGIPGKVLLPQRVVRHLFELLLSAEGLRDHFEFLHVVACCPTPTPGPPQVPCQGSRGTAGPPQRQVPRGPVSRRDLATSPLKGLCKPSVAAGGLKPPTRSPG